ncbi:MAG: 2-hydroxychromene-2-carboxylate isomerase [Myxococcota bacterium]
MARTLRFSFDFISPYAYLAWLRVHDFAARVGVELQTEPVLFAAMLNAYGHKGPAEIPPKRIYTFKHVLRLAADQGVPLRPPPAHPFNPLLGLRLATLDLPAQQRRGLIDVLFARVWITGEGITDPEALAKGLTRSGHDGAGLVAAALAPQNKLRLRTATEEAVGRGLFGVPSFEIDGEMFWGQDAYPHIERFIAGHDPVPADVLAQWGDLPAQAKRDG